MRADSPLVATVSASPNFNDRKGRAIDAVVLHYTGMETGDAARTRLIDPASDVSCHYLVWEDGRIEQLVAEADRAWHAGRSYWAGETDLNSVSVGIEIVNGGHEWGAPPYPSVQIESVVALCRDIVGRRALDPRRILAHSDIAPDRKQDPGEWFPWQRLAAAGLGLWPPSSPSADTGPIDLAEVQAALGALGYLCPISGLEDRPTTDAITAFQRRYRRDRIDGRIDPQTHAVLKALIGLRP